MVDFVGSMFCLGLGSSFLLATRMWVSFVLRLLYPFVLYIFRYTLALSEAF